MGLQTKHVLVCDRCGAEQPAEPRWGSSLADALDAAAKAGHDWLKADDRRVLCPDCKPAYEAMLAEHERDVAEFFRER